MFCHFHRIIFTRRKKITDIFKELGSVVLDAENKVWQEVCNAAKRDTHYCRCTIDMGKFQTSVGKISREKQENFILLFSRASFLLGKFHARVYCCAKEERENSRVTKFTRIKHVFFRKFMHISLWNFRYFGKRKDIDKGRFWAHLNWIFPTLQGFVYIVIWSYLSSFRVYWPKYASEGWF